MLQEIEVTCYKSRRLYTNDAFCGSSESEKLMELELQKDCCYPLYYSATNQHNNDINHFSQSPPTGTSML